MVRSDKGMFSSCGFSGCNGVIDRMSVGCIMFFCQYSRYSDKVHIPVKGFHCVGFQVVLELLRGCLLGDKCFVSSLGTVTRFIFQSESLQKTFRISSKFKFGNEIVQVNLQS